MARALDSILSELNNVYNPQRDVIRQQQEAIDPALQAEEKGLNFAKNDAFQQITDQANRRGLFYSGIPVAEEQKYTGGTFLPALANLRSKYQQQRFNLSDALNKIQADQYNQAYGIYQKEVAADEEARRWNEQLAAQERAARASGGGGGASGGGGGASPSFGGPVLGESTGIPSQQPRLSLRQAWQQQAKAGDWTAQVALNYAGDDGRFDGPVNSQAEYDVLKRLGIQGNYYVRGNSGGGDRSLGGALRNAISTVKKRI